MLAATEMNDICKRLVTAIQSLAPKTEYEEFYKIVEKREKGYEERILRDIQSGITPETLMSKGHKKTLEEKVAVAKQKKQQKRVKRKKEARDNLTKEEIVQDDRFYFITGYISGGATYGVTYDCSGNHEWKVCKCRSALSLRTRILSLWSYHHTSKHGKLDDTIGRKLSGCVV